MSSSFKLPFEIPEPGKYTPHTYHGGCHCGRVKFELIAPPPTEMVVSACNCSFCSIRAALMTYTMPAQITWTPGSLEGLKQYRWNTKRGPHYFCPECGTGLATEFFGIWGINMRCVPDVDVESMKVNKIDGKTNIPRVDG